MQDIQYATPKKWLFDTPGGRDPMGWEPLLYSIETEWLLP